MMWASVLTGEASPRPITVRPVRGRRDIKDFVDLPWQVYEGDPHWVPPLRRSVRHGMSPRHNPLHQEATIEHFLARDSSGRALGRVAATIHPAYVDRFGPRAFFGFFESVPDERVARALLKAVEAWAACRGMATVAGPYSYTSSQDVGFVVEGHDKAPAVLQSHNPAYYPALIEEAGYKHSFEMLAYTWSRAEHGCLAPDLLQRGEDAARAEGFSVRPVDMSRYSEELELLRRLYNSSFSVHPESVPLSRSVFSWQAAELKPIVDPDLIRIIEHDGRPVAFCLMVPNVNEFLGRFDGRITPGLVLRGRALLQSVRSAIVVMIGAEPDVFGHGLGRMLVAEIVRAAMYTRYDTVHTTWIHEDNVACRTVIDYLKTAPVRRYAVLERAL